MRIKFGEYMPDLAPADNPGLSVAKNCLPYANHYRSMPNLTTYSLNGLNGEAKGFFTGRNNAGVVYTYAGDTSALYRLSSSSFADASRTSGGAYSAAADDNWEFVQWGNKVVASNYTDVIQAITFGSSNFAALAGSPPKARHMATVRDFLVLGNVTDYSGGAALPERIHWSAFDNIESWTPLASTQADYQDLKGNGGWVQKIIGGEKGLILQERSIQLMTYVGPPVIFQIDEIEPGKGTPAPNSVIVSGTKVFYLGQDDFYMFQGLQSVPIGHDRIYQTFTDEFDQSYPNRVFAGVDPYKPFVFWAYPISGSTNGRPNRMIVYNHAINKWAGPIDIEVEILCNMRSEGYTLDELDTINASLDALPFSLDSRYYMGGTINMGAFNTSHYLSIFNGSDLTAVFETGDRQLLEGRRTLITNTRPWVEGASASISVALSGRNKMTESASYGSSVVMNSEGEAPIENEARYHRFRTTVAGGFTHASGIEVQAGPGGEY